MPCSSLHNGSKMAITQLDTSCKQIKIPVQGMGYHFLNCQPVGPNMHPRIIRSWNMFSFSLMFDYQTLLLKTTHTWSRDYDETKVASEKYS